VAEFDFPDFEVDYQCVALKHLDEYPMNDGRIISTSGLNVAVEEYEENFQERHLPQSTALHSVMLPDQTPYLVGPLARMNLCFDQLSSAAKGAAEMATIPWPSRNNFHSIIARGVEMVDAFDEAIAIVRDYNAEPSPSRVPYEAKAGEGRHATEAPRDQSATQKCEHLIRNYDPCISCSTHFLTMTMDRK
jgi:coenzyme F420-reducing hydrogenase alpha subunit